MRAHREEIHPMLTFVRAGIVAALVALLPVFTAVTGRRRKGLPAR